VGPYHDRYGLGLGRINGWLGHTADLLGFQSLVMRNLVANETVVIFVNASNSDHIPTDLSVQHHADPRHPVEGMACSR
jgi:D-alanyl-D-alanine carboxypeptidase